MAMGLKGYKVVLRYLDGRVEKSVAKQPAVNRNTFQILTDEGKIVSVPLHKLKAVFFVKDLEGNPRYDERKSLGPDSPRLGYEVTVTFHDGEVLVGRTMNPEFGDHGFYMEPADPQSNNERIFVVRQNIRKLTVSGDL